MRLSHWSRSGFICGWNRRVEGKLLCVTVCYWVCAWGRRDPTASHCVKALHIRLKFFLKYLDFFQRSRLVDPFPPASVALRRNEQFLSTDTNMSAVLQLYSDTLDVKSAWLWPCSHSFICCRWLHKHPNLHGPQRSLTAVITYSLML